MKIDRLQWLVTVLARHRFRHADDAWLATRIRTCLARLGKRLPAPSGRPRVFVAVKHTNWEQTGLVDTWERLAEVVAYDWGERFDQRSPRWHEGEKEAFNAILFENVLAEHQRKKVDLFFSYLSGRWVFPKTIEKIGALGIITVNIGFDDTRTFWGKREKTGLSGNAAIAPHFDLCLTCQNRRDIYKYLHTGANPLFLPPGGNEKVFGAVTPSPEPGFPVSFIGQRYGRRGSLIRHLEKSGIPVLARGLGWDAGPVSQAEMLDIYRNSRLTLGFGYIGSSRRTGLKGRDFEVAMTGTPYLTTFHEDLVRYLTPGQELLVYRDETELTARVRHALDHPEELCRMGLAAKARCLREHTWEQRWKTVIELCRTP